MSDYISLIAISGVLGIIHYWLFSSLNLLNFFDHNEPDEKKSLIIGLGLVNFVVYDALIYFTHNDWELWLYIVCSFFSALAVEFIVFLFIKGINALMRRYIFNDKKSFRFYLPIIKQMIEEDIGTEKKIYVYIFDFDNKIIEHGRLKYYSPNKKEESSVVLQIDPDSSDVETEFDKLRSMFPIDDTMDVYVNFEHHYKMYLVIEEDS